MSAQVTLLIAEDLILALLAAFLFWGDSDVPGWFALAALISNTAFTTLNPREEKTP